MESAQGRIPSLDKNGERGHHFCIITASPFYTKPIVGLTFFSGGRTFGSRFFSDNFSFGGCLFLCNWHDNLLPKIVSGAGLAAPLKYIYKRKKSYLV
jgi:hypothetical protein